MQKNSKRPSLPEVAGTKRHYQDAQLEKIIKWFLVATSYAFLFDKDEREFSRLNG